MDCGVPFCHTGCPVNNIIPDWNDLVYRGRWQEAIRSLHATNNFPEFTGRICPAPCEASCVLGINEPPVTIKHIEKTIIDRAFAEGWIRPEPPAYRPASASPSSAPVPRGSPPRNNSRRAGHAVTVFEKSRPHRRTAALRHPQFQDGESISSTAASQQMDAEGVEFVINAHVGPDVTVDDLRRDFDAILLAGGAEQPRDLECPRPRTERHPLRDGLPAAAEPPLRRRQRPVAKTPSSPPASASSSSAAAIPAPTVSARRTARRRSSVHQFEFLPKPPDERAPQTPWPLWPMQLRIESSHEEGGIRDWSVSTTAFTGDEHGNVKQLHGVRVGPPPEFEPIPGIGVSLSMCDLVLLAMGFLGPVRNGLLDELGGEARSARQRRDRRELYDLRPRRLRRRRHAPRPIARRVGDRRRPQSRAISQQFFERKFSRLDKLETTPDAAALRARFACRCPSHPGRCDASISAARCTGNSAPLRPHSF